jgi:hypothetical protein
MLFARKYHDHGSTRNTGPLQNARLFAYFCRGLPETFSWAGDRGYAQAPSPFEATQLASASNSSSREFEAVGRPRRLQWSEFLTDVPSYNSPEVECEDREPRDMGNLSRRPRHI